MKADVATNRFKVCPQRKWTTVVVWGGNETRQEYARDQLKMRICVEIQGKKMGSEKEKDGMWGGEVSGSLYRFVNVGEKLISESMRKAK